MSFFLITQFLDCCKDCQFSSSSIIGQQILHWPKINLTIELMPLWVSESLLLINCFGKLTVVNSKKVKVRSSFKKEKDNVYEEADYPHDSFGVLHLSAC